MRIHYKVLAFHFNNPDSLSSYTNISITMNSVSLSSVISYKTAVIYLQKGSEITVNITNSIFSSNQGFNGLADIFSDDL